MGEWSIFVARDLLVELLCELFKWGIFDNSAHFLALF